jgi:hypothetical protein
VKDAATPSPCLDAPEDFVTNQDLVPSRGDDEEFVIVVSGAPPVQSTGDVAAASA